jgi:CysZ protein
MGLSLGKLFFVLLGQVLLFPLSWLPLLGPVLWLVLSALWGSYWVSFEFLGAVMARHDFPLQRIRDSLRQPRCEMVGLGLGAFFALEIPVLNLFIFPIMVVAATRMFHRMQGVTRS